MRHTRDLAHYSPLLSASRARRRDLLRSPLLSADLKSWLRPGLAGSGLTWTDVMGNNNATLRATPDLPWATTERGLHPAPRGGGDFITIPGSQIQTTGTEAIWFRISTVFTPVADASPVLMMSNAHYWGITGTGSIRLEFHNGAWRVATAGDIVQNRWYHAAISHTTSDTKMYLDGVEVYAGAQTIGAGTTTTYIGARSDAISDPYTLQGYISDVMFFNRMLSASEIAALYQVTKHF